MTCIAAAIAFAVVVHVLRLTPIAVVSGSMEPSIPTHSLVFVEQVDPDRVERGDVITFDAPGVAPRTTHRVADRIRRGDDWYFITKGDANPVADDWRSGMASPESWMRGVTFGSRDALRVRFHVPVLGRAHVLSADERMRTALIALPFALLALLAVRAIWQPRARPPIEVVRDDDSWLDDDEDEWLVA